MTLTEFIKAVDEKATKVASVVVTLAALVDKADNAADMVPAGILPKDLQAARTALDEIRYMLDQAVSLIEQAKAAHQPVTDNGAEAGAEVEADAAQTVAEAAGARSLFGKIVAEVEADAEAVESFVKKVVKIDPVEIAKRLAESRAKKKEAADGTDGST